MADFQQTVGKKLAPGLPGSHFGVGPGNSDLHVYQAAEDVIPGTFVCNTHEGTANVNEENTPKQCAYHKTDNAGGVSATVGEVSVGLVTRDSTGYIADVMALASNIINKSLPVHVAPWGEWEAYVPEVASGTATIGMEIFADMAAKGQPHAAAPADTPPSGQIKTGYFLVAILDAPSGMCGISSLRRG